MLRIFWEGHDPTQGMRQGNDIGTQYRSLLMWSDDAARRRRGLAAGYQERSPRPATARSRPSSRRRRGHPFYYAEDYHQQYLAKNPEGYCGFGGTGVCCPVGLHA